MEWKMTLLNEWTKGREEGREEGREVGREEGILETLSSLVKDGVITEQEAAQRAGLSVDDFRSRRESVGQVR